MKKFIISGCSSFLVLFFLSLASPLLLNAGDALAGGCEGVGEMTVSDGTADTGLQMCTGLIEGDCLGGSPTTTLSLDIGYADGCNWIESYADENAFVTTLCNIFKLVTGNGGKAFAAFAIISIGIGFFTGKVSWGLMLGVAAGIAAMFGAPSIVAAISGGNVFECAGNFEI